MQTQHRATYIVESLARGTKLRVKGKCHEIDVDETRRSARGNHRFSVTERTLYNREILPFPDEDKGHGRLFWKGFEYVALHMASWRWAELEVNNALNKLVHGKVYPMLQGKMNYRVLAANR